jgi:D-glycero-alpha-D-manno-heptose-7-phosphate kinase
VTTITATAPVRVCDAGGWTDTWFARHGLVCSVAVEPGARVEVELGDEPGPMVLEVAAPGPHPLLDAAIREWPVPEGRTARITVGAAVPPGSGVGTSAAVVVALLAALRAARAQPLDPNALARNAHSIETSLGLQSGVQDQYAAAHGRCNVIRVDAYPTAAVEPIEVPSECLAALDARLVTVFLGRPHQSSRVHETVIAHLERNGTDADTQLEPLRAAAAAAGDALAAGDVERYGAALTANTVAQAALHPALVSSDAHALIALAGRHDSVGWKVNGAGGDGGTVTIVASANPVRRADLAAAIDAVDRWQRLPLRLARRGAVAHVSP